MKKSTKGFSLIELLIVVAIILIIAAIAVPSLLRSRIAANQASASQSLRTYNSAEVSYASTYGVGYSPTLTALGPNSGGNPTASAAGLVDSLLGVDPGTKSGYSFVYSAGSAVNGVVNTYTLAATPLTAGTTGTNNYCTDQSFVIRFTADGTACSAASNPIGN